jgi:hypothetical protein
MKINTLTIIMIIIFMIVILNYVRREHFTTEAKLTEYLNTWNLTNQEIGNTMTVTSDKIKFNKNTDMTNLNASSVSAKDITSTGKLYVSNLSSNSNNIEVDTYKNMKINQGMLQVTGWTGGNTGSVIAQQQFCIGDEKDKTCISREHLKLLTGERNVFLKNVKHNSFIDCGGDVRNASGTTAKMTQGRSCYANDLDKNNNQQSFRLEF